MSATLESAAAVELLHADCWHSVGDRVELIAHACERCATAYLPRTLTCVRCGGQAFSPRTLSRAGTLYSYSIIHGAGGVWPAAYTVGYVDYPEGVRVFGQIREISPDLLHVGASMTTEAAVLYQRKDGVGVRCYRFHLADEGMP